MSAALRRAGYRVGRVVATNWCFATRSLRGPAELASEVSHLEAIAHDPAAIERLPARAPRGRTHDARRLAGAAQRYLEMRPGWTWTWGAAKRTGRPAFLEAGAWRALTYCSLLDDPADDWHLNVGVQLFQAGSPDPRSLRRIRRTLRSLLDRHGYRMLRQRAAPGRAASFAMMDMDLRSLASARRERARLDALIFGA